MNGHCFEMTGGTRFSPGVLNSLRPFENYLKSFCTFFLNRHHRSVCAVIIFADGEIKKINCIFTANAMKTRLFFFRGTTFSLSNN